MVCSAPNSEARQGVCRCKRGYTGDPLDIGAIDYHLVEWSLCTPMTLSGAVQEWAVLARWARSNGCGGSVAGSTAGEDRPPLA